MWSTRSTASAWCFFNSSGGPDWFRISGGLGRPSDIPRGVPASRGDDSQLFGGGPDRSSNDRRPLAVHGAFDYFGAVNEPFLLAFRPPGLVAELLAAGVPFVAALRQGEHEPFGFPWRLVYLGDPLYRLETAKRPSPGSMHAKASGRMSPVDWRKMAH